MKKLIFSLLFIFEIISYSASKGNYSVNKYRQDVINYAMAQVGKKYSQDYRMNPNTYDCSSLVDRASQAAGMNSVTGKDTRNWSNTTQSMRSNGRPKKIPKEQIKAGDAILFNGHVVYALGTPNGCYVDVVHASNSRPYPRGGVKVSKNYNICTNHGGYIGVISAEQVLINNGYTPVDNNGQIIIPPTGGSALPTRTITPANLNDTYEISWDAMATEYKRMIFEGLETIMDGFLTLLSLLTVIQIMMIVTPYMFGNETNNLFNEVTAIGVKFSFYAYIIKNYESIINMMYGIFSGIGSIFLKNNKLHTLDELFALSMKEVMKIMKLIEQYHFDVLKILIPGSNIFDITFWKVIVLVIIMLMIGYFSAKLVFELIAVINQFYLSFGLSFIYFCLGTNELTQEFARRPLRTLLGSGLRITITIIFASLVFGILQKANFGDVTLDTVKFETMFTFVTSGLIMAFLMNKTTYIADRLNG